METATVVVAPAPVAITQPPQHKLMELKPSFAAVAKPSPGEEGQAGKKKLAGGSGGYVLEDVPHLTDYLPELKSYPNPLQDHPAYSVCQAVLREPGRHGGEEDRGAQEQRPRDALPARRPASARLLPAGRGDGGDRHLRRPLPWPQHRDPRARVRPPRHVRRDQHLRHRGRVQGVLRAQHGGADAALRERHPQARRHGAGHLRGGQDTAKIVDSIQDRGVNQVYIIGGDGTQKGAASIHEEVQRRGLKCAVVGVPKTIDNDIAVIDKSFGFDTAVEEAQRAINAAHVEAESAENGIGVVKLMGRNSGFIAMYATLASRDVDCCLIPESPFYLDGKGGLLEFVEKRLRDNGHMVIVVAEGAGQDLIAKSMNFADTHDASGNKVLLDVGLWLSHKIKEHFKKKPSFPITLKYIDPTYMIRAVPSNASDNVYCTLLAHSALHGAMAGYTGFTVAPVNGRHAYIPFYRITEKQNKVVITDRMWARVLCSTNQPCFLTHEDVEGAALDEEEPHIPLVEGENALVRNPSMCSGNAHLCSGAA
ncbi:unnamed protein product [Miscanthus lutarioriparius]|uniref:Phosphofructokinase domain-containing protein n=1 Tax=Miscanthus lutarioriparius TaxID=422564 RepID=A0A811SLD0_9POAL|nr:unnamed protein product [Miscanthus lutarioriparius]